MENFQALWADHNKKLERNLQINEELLRKMNLDKVKQELVKPLAAEMWNIGLTAVFMLYLGTISILLLDQWRFSIPGLVAATCGGALIAFSILRARKIAAMDYHSPAVLDIQKQFLAFQGFRSRLGKVELIVAIIPVVTMWPIILYTGFGIDIYQNHKALLIALLVCAIIVTPLTILLEKTYRKRLRNTSRSLQEILDWEAGFK